MLVLTECFVYSFSVDEGLTWKSYPFYTQLVQVNGVLNEPGTTTLNVT